MLSSFCEFGNKDQTEATFVIPDINKLATGLRVSDLCIILVSSGMHYVFVIAFYSTLYYLPYLFYSTFLEGEFREVLSENHQSENHVQLVPFPSKLFTLIRKM